MPPIGGTSGSPKAVSFGLNGILLKLRVAEAGVRPVAR